MYSRVRTSRHKRTIELQIDMTRNEILSNNNVMVRISIILTKETILKEEKEKKSNTTLYITVGSLMTF